MVDGRAAAQTMINFGTWRAGYCLEAVWQAFKRVGASTGRSAATALLGWERSDGKHPGDWNPPAGVPVWFGAKPGNNKGDVVISLGGGRVVATDWPRNGVIGTTTIAERQKQIGRPYLGWTERIFDVPITFDGGSADVGAGQRKTGNDIVNRRTEPRSSAPLAGDPLPANTVGNFVGWIRGENVKGNDVWYKGTSGHWFWSGGFIEGANGTGLTDLNPTSPPVSGTQRVVLATDVVKRRTQPTSKSPEAGAPLPAGAVGNFTGWVHGESVAGNDVWFLGTSGNWFWSGGFVGGANTAGLTDLNQTTTPPVVTPPAGSVLDPAAPWKNQAPDSPLATWIGSPNYNNSATGKGAKTKTQVTEHWFGTDSTLAGTDSHFQNPGEIKNGRGTGTSSQYAVGADGAIHQYVKEAEYAHTNGTYEGNAVAITIEHECGPGKPATEALIEASAKLHADIARRHGWKEFVWEENAFPHSHFVATQCPGDLPTGEILRRANLLLNPPEPEPEPGDGESAADALLKRAAELIEANTKLLADIRSWAAGE